MTINIAIRSPEEREIAMNIIQKLSGALEDTPEIIRLEMLIEAVESWDANSSEGPLSELNALSPGRRRQA
jgi:hypothetical protein